MRWPALSVYSTAPSISQVSLRFAALGAFSDPTPTQASTSGGMSGVAKDEDQEAPALDRTMPDWIAELLKLAKADFGKPSGEDPQIEMMMNKMLARKEKIHEVPLWTIKLDAFAMPGSSARQRRQYQTDAIIVHITLAQMI